MKRYSLVLFFFISAIGWAFTQNCYQLFYTDGIKQIQQNNFDAAIKSFKAAKVCADKPQENDIDEKILDAQNGYILAIQKARDEALIAKARADSALTLANDIIKVIWELKNLFSLNLSNTDLSSLPIEIWELKYLKYVRLEEKNFSFEEIIRIKNQAPKDCKVIFRTDRYN